MAARRRADSARTDVARNSAHRMSVAFALLILLSAGTSTAHAGSTPDGGACTVATDCAGGACINNLCCTPTGTDCGGTCPQKCGSGQTCNTDGDCLPGHECYGVCGCVDTCTNPGSCANGDRCDVNSDCASGFCSGGCCAPCSTSTECSTGEVCVSGVCQTATSTPTPTGTPTTTPTDTPTPTATPTASPTRTPALIGLGLSCASASDCPSTFCVGGVCCDTACAGTNETCTAPGRVGICSANAAAPTLSLPTLCALVLLLIGVGALALRRHFANPR